MGGLTSSQLANAGAIIEEGNRLHVPARGIVIALAMASQESHFTNYANDGKGGDLISIQHGHRAVTATCRTRRSAPTTDRSGSSSSSGRGGAPCTS